MAKRTWTFLVDGEPHTVELEHSYWSGRIVISLDGETVYSGQKRTDPSGRYPFLIEGHTCWILIAYRGFVFHYDCLVDRYSVETGNPDLGLRAGWFSWPRLVRIGIFSTVFRASAAGLVLIGIALFLSYAVERRRLESRWTNLLLQAAIVIGFMISFVLVSAPTR